MLKNKIVLILILLFITSGCSDTFSYEGKIMDIDASLLSGMKSVSTITLVDNDGKRKVFEIKSGSFLEDINIAFTYSHVKSHMEDGEEVYIKYSEINNKNIIIDFKFLGHNH